MQVSDDQSSISPVQWQLDHPFAIQVALVLELRLVLQRYMCLMQSETVCLRRQALVERVQLASKREQSLQEREAAVAAREEEVTNVERNLREGMRQSRWGLPQVLAPKGVYK